MGHMLGPLHELHSASQKPPLITCVFLSPCRFESGDCYAIDMGGTNFRVMYVRLSKEKCVVVSDGVVQQILHDATH